MKKILKLIIAILLISAPVLVIAATTENEIPFVLPSGTKKDRQALREKGVQNPSTSATIEAQEETAISYGSQAIKTYAENTTKSAETLIRLGGKVENKDAGVKIKVIGETQTHSIETVNKTVIKADKRSKWLKFLIGPDYKALKQLRQEIKDNYTRINKLEEINKNLVFNKEQKTGLQKEIDTLKAQNRLLLDELDSREKQFGLLGWLFKLIYRY